MFRAILSALLSVLPVSVRDERPTIPLPVLKSEPFSHVESKFYLPRTFKTSWRYQKPGKYRPHQGKQECERRRRQNGWYWNALDDTARLNELRVRLADRPAA